MSVKYKSMILLPPIWIDFHGPLVAVLTGFHWSLCNCCFSVIVQPFFLMDKQGRKASDPCITLAIKLWLGYFFHTPYSLYYRSAPQPHLRQRLNETKISLDHRLAGFLSTAFNYAFFCSQSATASLLHSKTTWLWVTLFKWRILHDTITIFLYFLFPWY